MTLSKSELASKNKSDLVTICMSLQNEISELKEINT